MAKANYKPNLIIGVVRGGLVPATVLSYRLNVPLAATVRVYQNVTQAYHLLPQDVGYYKHVLVVDDVSDSGATLKQIKEAWPAVKTLTIFVKPGTSFIPDFYIAGTDVWINFPWEVKV